MAAGAEVDVVVASGGLENVKQSDFQKPTNTGKAPTTKNPTQNAAIGSGSQIVLMSMYAQQLVGIGKQTATSWVNFAKSSYGDYTGDLLGQRKIDNAFEIGNFAISTVTSLVGAYAAGGFAGLVMSGTMQATSLATSYIQGEIAYKRQITKANVQSGFNASRIGDILINGNRG